MSKQQQRDTIVYGVWSGRRSDDGNPADVKWRLVFTATNMRDAASYANGIPIIQYPNWWVIIGYSRRGRVFVSDVCMALKSSPHYAGLAELMTWLDDDDYWRAMCAICGTTQLDPYQEDHDRAKGSLAIGSRPRSAHVEPPLARPGDKGIDLGTGESYTVPEE